MAGINRLGKAPPKPGTLRPPDPNKYRTVDMFSEGAEADMDYLKTVRDIEEMQQQQGWLFGRGAFDKADLLYLRDTAEQQRHMELELRDSERNQFAALRAKLEHQPQDAVTSSSRPKRERDHMSEASASKPPPKITPSIKPKQWLSAKQDKRKDEQQVNEPPDKRTKNDGYDQRVTTSLQSSQASGSSKHESKPPPSAATPAGNNEDSEDAGLLGLLGAYGSDSGQEDSGTSDSRSEDSDDSNDSSDKERGGDSTTPGDEHEKSSSGLPSAAALLGDQPFTQ